MYLLFLPLLSLLFLVSSLRLRVGAPEERRVATCRGEREPVVPMVLLLAPLPLSLRADFLAVRLNRALVSRKRRKSSDLATEFNV